MAKKANFLNGLTQHDAKAVSEQENAASEKTSAMQIEGAVNDYSQYRDEVARIDHDTLTEAFLTLAGAYVTEDEFMTVLDAYGAEEEAPMAELPMEPMPELEQQMQPELSPELAQGPSAPVSPQKKKQPVAPMPSAQGAVI